MKVSAKLQTARQMQQDIVLNRTLQEIEKASNILFLKLNNTSYTETAKLLNYLKFFLLWHLVWWKATLEALQTRPICQILFAGINSLAV